MLKMMICAGILAAAWPVAVMAQDLPPSQHCTADADAQKLAGAPREMFLKRCDAGRTPPIAGTPNAPAAPDDPAALCKAKAVGAKMTGVARENYLRDCIKKQQNGPL